MIRQLILLGILEKDRHNQMKLISDTTGKAHK